MINNYDKILSYAIDCMDIGDYNSAIIKLNEVLAFNPNNKEAKNYLAVSYYNIGKYNKSYEILKNIINKEKNIDETLFKNIYNVANKINKLDDLEECFKKKAQLSNDIIEKIMLLNLYNKRINDYSLALNRDYLNKYLEKSENTIKNIKAYFIDSDMKRENYVEEVIGYKEQPLYDLVKFTIDIAEKTLNDKERKNYEVIKENLKELKQALLKNDEKLVKEIDLRLMDIL